MYLQTYNEVQHCFLTVGQVYPEDMFAFLLYVGNIYKYYIMQFLLVIFL